MTLSIQKAPMPDTPKPPDLPALATEPERLAALRSRAASRLRGPAAAKGYVASAADALSVLHALASSPETAADALTLLHEMQVLQVELDLQAQELRESRSELEIALRRQTELYDFQPVGAFTVDPNFALHELNRTGAEMLAIARDDARGMPLDAFFCADSARRFRAAIASLGAGTPRATCAVRLRPKDGAERPMLVSVGADPAGDRFLVNLMDVAVEDGQPSAPARI